MRAFLLTMAVLLAGCEADRMYFQPNSPQSRSAEVFSLSRLVASPGDVVRVSGRGFNKGMKVEIDGQSLNLQVDSSSEAFFVMPSVSPNPNIGVVFIDSSSKVAGYLALMSSAAQSKMPVMDADPGLICSDVTYRNPDGQIKVGNRTCSNDFLHCSRDGDINCVANASFPSVNLDSVKLQSRLMHTSLSIAGVSGLLPDCNEDGSFGCIVTGPLMAAAVKVGANAKILTGQSVAGVTGSYVPDFPSRSNVRLGDTVDNANGLLRDCNADNDTICVSSAAFPSIIKANLSAGVIKLGQTVAAMLGTLPFLRSPSLAVVKQKSDAIVLNVGEQCCETVGSLIVRSLDAASTWSPTNGTSYTVGTIVGAGQTIVAVSSLNLLADTTLLPARAYFYKAWAYDAANNYSATPVLADSITLPGNNFGSFLHKNELWVSRRSSSTYLGWPGTVNVASDTIWMTGALPGQGGMTTPLRLFELPLTAEFDYRLVADAADGFHFAWGKDITEYNSNEPLGVGGVGTSSAPSPTGYGILFHTYSNGGYTANVSLVRFVDNVVLSTFNVPLEDFINTDRHVKIVVTAHQVKLYLFGSSTPTIDYDNGSNWTITHKFVAFGAGTGGEWTDQFLSNITFTSP
ncbi:MAG: hypothetical protein EOP10_09020 [Proteobacteria bacterium]|nr:MAG: hypothetical protein EOP10_09020 [Pseudomonadota bacterium]